MSYVLRLRLQFLSASIHTSRLKIYLHFLLCAVLYFQVRLITVLSGLNIFTRPISINYGPATGTALSFERVLLEVLGWAVSIGGVSKN